MEPKNSKDEMTKPAKIDKWDTNSKYKLHSHGLQADRRSRSSIARYSPNVNGLLQTRRAQLMQLDKCCNAHRSPTRVRCTGRVQGRARRRGPRVAPPATTSTAAVGTAGSIADARLRPSARPTTIAMRLSPNTLG